MSKSALMIPEVPDAKLPVNYEQARTALANVQKIDECRDWADKAMALASYARQAKDDTLVKLSMKIQSRAIQRCGELLQQVPPGQGARDGKRQEGDLPPLNRTQVAEDAGLSEHQRKTALRLANIPKDEFDSLVESDDPPTVTELAEIGKNRGEFVAPDDPEAFNAGILLRGRIRDLNQQLSKFPDMDRIFMAWDVSDRMAVAAWLGGASGPLSRLMELLGGDADVH